MMYFGNYGCICGYNICTDCYSCGGVDHAKTEMEPEYCLHIRAAARELAAHFPLRHDDRGRAYGLREDHSGELVSQ